MAGEIDLAKGVDVEDTSNTMMKTGVVKATSGNSHVGDNTDTRQEGNCSPSVHDDNFNLANSVSEKDIERYNNNPGEETNRVEKPKESLKRSLSQPQISAFLKKDGDQSSASKRVKLDVLNDTEVDSSRNKELSAMKESKKEVEDHNTEVGVEEKDQTDEDKVRKGDDEGGKCEDNKEIEETKEDENLQENASWEEGRDAKDESCEKEEKVEDDTKAQEGEGQKEEDEGQKEEDGGQKEGDGKKDEDERQKKGDGQKKEGEGQKLEDKRQKEDKNEEESSKKSIDKQGLPSGWSRLSVPRKNGTQVDYYLVNQQVWRTYDLEKRKYVVYVNITLPSRGRQSYWGPGLD